MMAPKGLGLLLGKKDSFKLLKPTIVGGGVVVDVTDDCYQLKPKPLEYESGTQSLEGIIGLAEAIRWIKSIDRGNLEKRLNAYDEKLCKYLNDRGIKILHPKHSTPTISIVLQDVDLTSIAAKLDKMAGIQVRTGFLCAMPFQKKDWCKKRRDEDFVWRLERRRGFGNFL